MNGDTTRMRLASALGWTGRYGIRLGTYPLDLCVFIFHTFHKALDAAPFRRRVIRRFAASQLFLTCVETLPVVILAAVTVGFTFGAPLIALVPDFGRDALTPVLLHIVGIELGPLLTAVFLIRRAGAAMVVELSNMQLHGEIAALEQLGIDVQGFFIAPRLFGGALAQLVLATYFTAAAIFAGVLLAGFVVAGEVTGLAEAIAMEIEPALVLAFVLKNLLFGLVVTGTACYSAMQVTNSPADVPHRTQEAMTSSLVLVFIVNAFISLLLI